LPGTARHVTGLGEEVGADVGGVVGADVGADVGGDVGGEVGADVGADVGGDVGADVGADVGGSVGCIVGDSVVGVPGLQTSAMLSGRGNTVVGQSSPPVSLVHCAMGEEASHRQMRL